MPFSERREISAADRSGRAAKLSVCRPSSKAHFRLFGSFQGLRQVLVQSAGQAYVRMCISCFSSVTCMLRHKFVCIWLFLLSWLRIVRATLTFAVLKQIPPVNRFTMDLKNVLAYDQLKDYHHWHTVGAWLFFMRALPATWSRLMLRGEAGWGPLCLLVVPHATQAHALWHGDGFCSGQSCVPFFS